MIIDKSLLNVAKQILIEKKDLIGIFFKYNNLTCSKFRPQNANTGFTFALHRNP